MLCTQCDKPTAPVVQIGTGPQFFVCDPDTLAEQSLACTTCGLVFCGTCATEWAIGLDNTPDLQVHLCPACSGLLSLYEA